MVRWRTDLGAPVTVAPNSEGDRVFVGTEAGTLHALGADSGEEQWSFDVDQAVRHRPACVGDLVVAVVGDEALGSHNAMVDAETGDQRWRFAPESWWLEPIGRTDETLFVGTADDAIEGSGQTLFALEAVTGEERWSAGIGDPSGGLVRDASVYVPAYDTLYAYATGDGDRRWTAGIGDYAYRSVAATPETVCLVAETDDSMGSVVGLDAATGDEAWTLAGGRLIVGGEHVAGLDPATGEPDWRVDAGGFVPRVPVSDGRLFVGGDRVRAHDVDDGDRRWSWTPQPAVEGVIPAAASAGLLYVNAFGEADPRNRYKFAVEAATGRQRWAFDGATELTDLAFGDDRAYVGGADGTVRALE